MFIASSTNQSITEGPTDSNTGPIENCSCLSSGSVIVDVLPSHHYRLGTFGNVMSIVIMSRMTSEEATVNLFFIGIAAGDLLVLITGQTRYWLEHVFDVLLFDVQPVLHYLCFWMVSSAGCFVSWMLASVTLQRALSVVWPHHVHHMCTRRRIVVSIIGQTLVLLVLYIHYLYCVPVVISSEASDVDCMSMASSSHYAWFVDNVFTYVELVMYSVLPFVCLVVGNTVLAATLVRSVRQARENMVIGNSKQALKREKETYSVTITVLVVSVTFVVLTLPICVYFLLFQFKDLSDMSSEDTANVYLFFTISYLMAGTNSAINFYLYCLTGRKFRAEFMRIMSFRTIKDRARSA